MGRSLREGFRASNSGWAGMACYAGAWIPVMIFLVIGLMMTNPPQELFEEAQQPAPALNQPQPSQPPAEQPSAAQPVPAAPVPADASAARADAEKTQQRNRVIEQWFSRAWFVLFLLVIFAVCANTWIAAGQIGFLHKQVSAGPANASDFWRTATAAFGPLLAASAVAFLIGLGGLLAYGLAALVFSGLANALPAGLLVFAGLILVLASVVVLLWLGVRLALWFIAIVVDRLGPVAGLKASFNATRSRWWPLFALLLVFGAINFGAWLSFWVLMVVLAALGSMLTAVFSILVVIAYVFLTQVYIAFAFTAAAIRFYLDARAQPAPDVQAGAS